MTESPLPHGDEPRSQWTTNPLAWYHAFFQHELERTIAQGKHLDSSLITKLGIDACREFLFVWPPLEEQPKLVTFLNVYNSEREPLFSLLKDPRGSERLTAAFRARIKVLATPEKAPAYEPDVNAYSISASSGELPAQVCYYHLDSTTDMKHHPSRWDCLVLRDGLGHCILYSPVGPSLNHPGFFAMSDLYLATGELVERNTRDRLEFAVFQDPQGHPLAEYRHDEIGSSLSLTSSIPPLVPLFHGIFHMMYGSVVGDFRRRHPERSLPGDSVRA